MTDLVLALATGAVVGGVILVAFGAPDRRMDGSRLAAISPDHGIRSPLLQPRPSAQTDHACSWP